CTEGVVATQLVTSRIGILGKPAFPPGTMASAVPLSPAHCAAGGMVTVSSTSPTRASAPREIVPTAREITTPRATRFTKSRLFPLIISTPSFVHHRQHGH